MEQTNKSELEMKALEMKALEEAGIDDFLDALMNNVTSKDKSNEEFKRELKVKMCNMSVENMKLLFETISVVIQAMTQNTN